MGLKMSVLITGVESGSLAEKKNISAGDTLLSINGCEILDVLDYRFYIVDSNLELELCDSAGVRRTVKLEKYQYDDIGLCFETYLMDNKHSCRNKCIFCFIDQLPKGLRESLYFKDDDERLSFLMGNYITLTNLGEREVGRIIDMHISPVNISVHTTNPELRVKMMGNKNAGASLDILRRLSSAGTAINCQLVLCRGVNDGDELNRSLRDLGELYPAVQSVAVVPVGLTKYRGGLYLLEPYDRSCARMVVEQVEEMGSQFKSKHATRLFYTADEFYIKAGRSIHGAGFYEGFAQLENGVGMLALFTDQFQRARKQNRRRGLSRPRRVSVATGTAAKPFIEKMVLAAMKDIDKLDCMVYAVNNVFFGENVNVSGLVTGKDLVSQLGGRDLGDELLLPANMLRSERDMFLDNTTLEDVERALSVRVVPVETGGAELFGALTGEIDA